MSFVEKISRHLAKWVASHVPNDKYPTVEDQIQVLTLGWMLPIGAVYKGILLIISSIILGIITSNILNALLSVIVVTITFSFLRIIAGGYHEQSYNLCIIVSLSQFLGSALVVLSTLQYWSQLDIWCLFLFCIVSALYNIKRYVPRDTPNKPITKQSDVTRLKRWSLYYLFTWTIIMTILLLFNLKLIIISSCFGLLLEIFSVSNVGQKIYSKLDLLFELNKK
jgi:accessory gene regulator B